MNVNLPAALVCFGCGLLPVYGQLPEITTISPSSSGTYSLPNQIMNANKPQYVTYVATPAYASISVLGPNLFQMGLQNTGIFPYSPGTFWIPNGSGYVTSQATVHQTATSSTRLVTVADLTDPTKSPVCYSQPGSPTGACPELMPGESAGNNSSDGFADPTMRRESTSNNIWMAYSHPTVSLGLQVIETHLSSTVDGITWQPPMILYNNSNAPYSACNTKQGQFTSHEVPNLWSNMGSWYVVSTEYCVDSQGSYRSQGAFLLEANFGSPANPTSPKTLNMSPSSKQTWSFSSLTQKVGQLLGTSLDCGGGWSEPSIFVAGGNLYMTAHCSPSSAPPAFYLLSFKSLQDLTLGDLRAAAGPFGGTADAARLAPAGIGATNYTQLDIARRALADEQFIAVATLFNIKGGKENHLGTQVFTFKVSPGNGEHYLNDSQAYIPDTTGSNFVNSYGQGASTYEASFPGGLLVVRRTGTAGIVAQILQTGVMP